MSTALFTTPPANSRYAAAPRPPLYHPLPSELPREISHRSLRCRLTSTSTGTSDEHLSLIEHLSPVHARLSAVIVTTPQAVALLDAMKCLSFTRATALPVLGLVENMSGYVCPCCGEVSNVFSTGGGEDMARREGLRLLGSLPVDTELVTLLDAAAVAESENEQREKESGGMEGVTAETQPPTAAFELLAKYEKTPTAKLFRDIAARAIENLNQGEDHLPR